MAASGAATPPTQVGGRPSSRCRSGTRPSTTTVGGLPLRRLARLARQLLGSGRALVRFKWEVVEHGQHGIVLGTDGPVYVIVGNHATIDGQYEAGSPNRDYYDTDLVPKYEDPGGHAVGIKAPGGVVIRTDT